MNVEKIPEGQTQNIAIAIAGVMRMRPVSML